MTDFQKRPPAKGCVAEVGNLDVIVKDHGIVLQGTEGEFLSWREVYDLHKALGEQLRLREGGTDE